MATVPTSRPSPTNPRADAEMDDARSTPRREQLGHPDATGAETPGDLSAPDIVGPTGEEMPVQSHDEVDGPDRGAEAGERRPDR